MDDCTEASITREFYRVVRSSDDGRLSDDLTKFETFVYNLCGEIAEDHAILLRTIVYTAVETRRIKRFSLISISRSVKHYFLRGDNVMGDKNVIKARDITNSQVGQTLAYCNNIIQQQPDSEKRNLLEQLRADVTKLLDDLPEDKKDKEQEIADYLKTIVDQSSGKVPPNKRFYQVSADGLLEASEWVKKFAGNIFGTIGQLGKMLWPDFVPTKSK